MKFVVAIILGLLTGGVHASTANRTEVVVGSEKAIVTLYEYGSLTCHVCARFATDVKDDLQKEFGDKLKIVMRPFPFNKIDIEGFKLVLCSKDPLKYSLAIYKKQDELYEAKDQVQAVKDIIKNTGMSAKEMEKCLADKQLEQQIIMKRQLIKANAAPVIKIGKVKVTGLPKPDMMKRLIKEAIDYVESGKDLSTFVGSEDLRKSLKLKPIKNAQSK